MIVVINTPTRYIVRWTAKKMLKNNTDSTEEQESSAEVDIAMQSDGTTMGIFTIRAWTWAPREERRDDNNDPGGHGNGRYHRLRSHTWGTFLKALNYRDVVREETSFNLVLEWLSSFSRERYHHVR